MATVLKIGTINAGYRGFSMPAKMRGTLHIVVGQGFGDEGKGTSVDFLSSAYHSALTLRFNGGCQAGHNVVSPGWTRHTFNQYGSATLLNIPTFLNRTFFLDPWKLIEETERLKNTRIPSLTSNPLELLTIDERAPLVLPFQIGLNQMTEKARASDRRGSIGYGIFEAYKDTPEGRELFPEEGVEGLTAGDFCWREKESLIQKLEVIRDKKQQIAANLLKEARTSGNPNLSSMQAIYNQFFKPYENESGLKGLADELIKLKGDLQLKEENNGINYFANLGLEKPSWVKAALTTSGNFALAFLRGILFPVLPYPHGRKLLCCDLKKPETTIIAEGAQGTLLDKDFGFFPYVSPSTALASGIKNALDYSIEELRTRGLKVNVIGVIRAYLTRHGPGPMPTEINPADVISDYAAQIYSHLGEDTLGLDWPEVSRPGWMDTVLLRYARALNGTNELFITCLDRLSGLKKIPVCTGYEYSGDRQAVERFFEFDDTGRISNIKIEKDETGTPRPFSQEDRKQLTNILFQVTPFYEWLDGWKEVISQARSFSNLPEAAKRYLEFIEKQSGQPIHYISVEPTRQHKFGAFYRGD